MRPEHGGQLNVIDSRDGGEWLDFSVNLNPHAPQPTDAEWLDWRKGVGSYPPPTSRSVDELLESYLGAAGTGWILATQGAMEALKLALESNCGRTIHIPVPCFSEYAYLCEQLGLEYRLRQVPEVGWTDGRSWIEMDFEPGSAVLLGNPNNPFGVSLCAEDLVPVLERFKRENIHLIVDEAFIELTGSPERNSLMSVLTNFPNLILTGSLTKSWSIPGMRLGYLATSDAHLMQRLRDQQITWPLSSIVQSWAECMLVKDRIARFREGLQGLLETRDKLFTSLRALPFLKVYPSDANYCVCETDSQSLSTMELVEFLRSRHIHVRICDRIAGLPKGRFFRIGVREPEMNERLLETLKEFGAGVASARSREAL